MYNTSTNSISQQPDLSTDSEEKNSGRKGKASQDLDFFDFLNENAERYSEDSDVVEDREHIRVFPHTMTALMSLLGMWTKKNPKLAEC